MIKQLQAIKEDLEKIIYTDISTERVVDVTKILGKIDILIEDSGDIPILKLRNERFEASNNALAYAMATTPGVIRGLIRDKRSVRLLANGAYVLVNGHLKIIKV